LSEKGVDYPIANPPKSNLGEIVVPTLLLATKLLRVLLEKSLFINLGIAGCTGRLESYYGLWSGKGWEVGRSRGRIMVDRDRSAWGRGRWEQIRMLEAPDF
jgi:hypothetical protein